ncbi:MAG TPA: hypothetical protein PLA41_02520 [Candidatus Pacearchaeota archaeon]|nr:hypothetical protein [Candidatus Pacearchaeota archaeon]HQI74704.1 hypothetical protein [Candidatus Pacearchaeota archaeon]
MSVKNDGEILVTRNDLEFAKVIIRDDLKEFSQKKTRERSFFISIMIRVQDIELIKEY